MQVKDLFSGFVQLFGRQSTFNSQGSFTRGDQSLPYVTEYVIAESQGQSGKVMVENAQKDACMLTRPRKKLRWAKSLPSTRPSCNSVTFVRLETPGLCPGFSVCALAQRFCRVLFSSSRFGGAGDDQAAIVYGKMGRWPPDWG